MRLLENPFYVLGATALNTRSELNALADDASLLGDVSQIAEARAILTNPRRRVEAEISWLPDVLDPSDTLELVTTLSADLREIVDFFDYASYANMSMINLAEFGIQNDDDFSVRDLDDWIGDILNSFAYLDRNSLLDSINSAREISGYPTVKNIDVIEEVIEQRQNEVAESIKKVLGRMSDSEASTQLEFVAEYHLIPEPIPKVWLDILADYELRISAKLADLTDQVNKLGESVEEFGLTPELTGQVDTFLHQWVSLAAPLIRSADSRGIEHGKTKIFLDSVRSICIDLHNKHQETSAATEITRKIQDVFSEFDSVCKIFEEDIKQLEKMLAEQDLEKIEPEFKHWARRMLGLMLNASEDPDSQRIALAMIILERKRFIYEHSNLYEIIGSDRFDDRLAIFLLSQCIDYANNQRLNAKRYEAILAILRYTITIAVSMELRVRIIKNKKIIESNYIAYKSRYILGIPTWIWGWGIIILLIWIFQ